MTRKRTALDREQCASHGVSEANDHFTKMILMKTTLSKSENRMARRLSLLGIGVVCATLLANVAGASVADAQGNEQVAKLTAVLKSDAPQKEKADACRELARIGDKDAVAALAALLPDEKLSHMARYGLETIPDPSVDKAFRDALPHLSGRPLVGVIGSIGFRQDAKATSLLAKRLTDSDPDVAQAAARALGRIATPAAAKAVQKALDRVSPQNQLAFCEGLLRCAEKLSVDHAKQAVAIYDRLRKVQGLHQVKTAALRGAILARGQAGLPLLVESLRSTDYPVFAAANRISQEIPGPQVTSALAAELPNNTGDRQVLLTLTLGKRGDLSALPALVSAATTCEKPVRLAAIRAISELCDPSAVRLFQQLLADSDPEIASAAQEALGALPGTEADSAALMMLRSPEPGRRAVGFELVSRRRRVSARPDLFTLAANGERAERATAMRKLGELGGPRELPGMLELLNRASSSEDIEATEQALSVVAVKGNRPDSTAQLLANSLKDAPIPQKCALLRVLAAVGGHTALQSVRLAVPDSSPEVRSAAIRTLSTWNSVEAGPDLLQLARDLTGPGEKMLCLRGYLALAGQADLPSDKALAMCREARPLVQQTDEKKLLLGALGNIQAPGSIELILPYLDDASVKEEAATACVNVSEKLLQGKDAATAAPQLLAPLKKVSAATANSDLAKRAQALAEKAEKK